MVVRTPGSVALSLAHVAAGRLDGFFFDRVNTWDVATDTLLFDEACGLVLDFSRAPVGLAEGTSPSGRRRCYHRWMPRSWWSGRLRQEAPASVSAIDHALLSQAVSAKEQWYLAISSCTFFVTSSGLNTLVSMGK